MAVYERLDAEGTVLERVITSDGSHEDTRLGLSAIDGRAGWTLVDEHGPELADVPDGAQVVLNRDVTAAAVKQPKGKRGD